MILGSLFADKLDINTASVKELSSLKGIGRTKATAIVQYREAHQFKDIEDIKSIKGIGDKIFDKIKDKIEIK
jgi:competence protein ComEA